MVSKIPMSTHRFFTLIALACALAGCGGKKEPASVQDLEARPDGRQYLKGESKPFTGRAVQNFPDGKQMMEMTFADGLANGPVTEWHSNGEKKFSTTYLNGKMDGRAMRWHTNGQMHMDATFKSGRQDGRGTEWDEEGNELRVEIWQDGRLLKTEMGQSVKTRLAKLESNRAEQDKTTWRLEVQAQYHEETFVALWDSLRAATDKWRPLEQFDVRRLILGEPREKTELDWGIQTRGFAAGGEELSTEQWRAWIGGLRKTGIELVETEWHQQQFKEKGPRGGPWSEFSFVAHARAQEPERRFLVRGRLGVHWSAVAGEKKLPSPEAIEVLKAQVWQRDGAPQFEKLQVLNPGADNPQARKGADTMAEPLLVQDLDGDGRAEILLVGMNRVYRPRAGGRFDHGPLFAFPLPGINGAVLADFTGDGHADLLCFPVGPPALYEGTAEGAFPGQPRPIKAISQPIKMAYGVTVGDIDGDGDLDVWVTQYRQPYDAATFPHPWYDSNDGWPAYLLLNDGRGGFTDATESAGLASKRHRRTYSTSLVDLDGDHDLDLVVINDFAGLDVYLNDGHGRFTDVSDTLGDHRRSFGMSHALADFDRDGRLDLYMTGMGSTTARRLEAMGAKRAGFAADNANRMKLGYGNRLLLGNGNGGLTQASFNNQLARTGWSWGCTAVDFDNDGDRDLYIANGNISRKTAKDYCTQFWRHDIYTRPEGKKDLAMSRLLVNGHEQLHEISWNGFEHNALLMNQGGKSFVNIGWLMGVSHEFDSRGVVSEDLDGDGWPELLVVQQRWVEGTGGAEQFLHIMKNRGVSRNHWIGVRLRGAPGKSPIGAKITMRLAGVETTLPVVTGDSYRSQHSTQKHFGLGTSTAVEEIVVRWPDGTISRLPNPASDQYHEIRPE